MKENKQVHISEMSTYFKLLIQILLKSSPVSMIGTAMCSHWLALKSHVLHVTGGHVAASSMILNLRV